MDINVSKRRDKIQQTNVILENLCYVEHVTYIEKATHWITDSGKLNQSQFWKDNVHPNKGGCNMFA